jgi:lysine 6-dehydrogenase
MKVVCLGATGGMGSRAASELARLRGIDDLVLADRITGPGVTTVVDVTDPAGLRTVLADADIVLNCTGPFFRFGVPVLRAAIDTRTAYLDICDDPEPTLAMLRLDGEAREKGVGAVIGMGASPGMSNLLAARAASRLDAVVDCFTVWPLDVPSPGQDGDTMDEGRGVDGRPSAAAIHLMEQISGEIHVVNGGALVRRRPLEPLALDFPGAGAGVAYTVGHPEPLTLLDSLSISGRAANAMLLKRSTASLLRTIGRDISAGRITHEQAAEAVLSPSPLRIAKAVVGAATTRGHGSLPPFFVLLRGMRDGRPCTVGCRLTSSPAGMAAATAIPAVLAIAQLIERPLPPGVHAPESVIDADRLLTDLMPYCALTPSKLDDLAPVSMGHGSAAAAASAR